MIHISDQIIKKQHNFWNHCLFHPTDAVEDPWGKRILDRMAADGAVNSVRLYTMFEDIVYLGEDDSLQYDFRISDLRLDYMLEKGYDLLLAYAGMPDCIAGNTANKTSVSKNKTRYKGKMFNTSPPKDYAVWEEICYTYTKHNVERYGLETVSKWYCQCFNEPDIPFFFLSELPFEAMQERLSEYCRMYEAFQKGVRRVSEKIPVGGPALSGARQYEFLGGLLDYVKEKELKLDFVSIHNYGTEPYRIVNGSEKICVANSIRHQKDVANCLAAHGCAEIPVVVDEWGVTTGGFCNREEYPELMFRETEVFSAYYAKLLCEYIRNDFCVERMMLCLSGQHEMVEDFTGFRNFFTLNFIAKPIYNAHVLASWLGEGLLEAKTDGENVFVLPTMTQDGGYAVLATYSSEYFDEDIPVRAETVRFAEDICGRQVKVWCIDKNTTNPYRLYEKLGIGQPNREEVRLLREEGTLKPVASFTAATSDVELRMTPNSVFLVTVSGKTV